MPARFDIAIVGGGPGGYVAALRAAQLGAKTALVERDRMGGTCLVRGCIPTKALLQSAELYSLVAKGAGLGVETSGLKFNFTTAQNRKAEVVDQLVKGVEGLLKAGGIETFRGHGSIGGPGQILVDGTTLEAENIIIATGSVPTVAPIPGAEHTVTSDGILELKEIPKRLVVIGGGVVGMEWGALFAALGSEVTVLEMLPEILPMAEADVVRAYRRHFEGLGATIHTGARVDRIAKVKDGITVFYTIDGESQAAAASVVLLATGRAPYTHGLGLERVGVELDRGRVKVDTSLRTTAPGIRAIGDVIGGIMLAHVASHEGVLAVESIVNHEERVPDYDAIPNCIYTDPEIAHVGLGESQARERGYEIQVGRVPFLASGRALTMGQSEGFIKVISDAKAGTLLGVHMVGPHVTELIAEATLAVQRKLTVADLEEAVHAHPTLSESFMEAALASENRAIAVPNKKRSLAAVATQAESQVTQTVASGAGSPNQEEQTVARRVQEKTQQMPNEPSQNVPALVIDPQRLELKKDNRDQLLSIHRMMYLIRRFEERTQEQYTKAKIGGYCHLNLGEEATVVGGIGPLAPGDYIYTSYREHGHAIARGVDPKAVMAELFGRETGVSRGRGGSMHIFDAGLRFMGGYGIVGGHLPLATGSAFAAKYTGTKDVVVCMFGDGAANIGAFHESLNISKVFNLPVIWFCVNNQYGMGTAVGRASAVTEMHKRACAYDMEAVAVDGMDVLAVAAKTAEFVAKSRNDSQPRFIEAVTYRFKGHSVVDPDKYRDEEEKARWAGHDPLRIFESRLKEAGVAGDDDFKKTFDAIEIEVDEIIKFADESPQPKVEELYKYVYAGDFEVGHNG
ncbi:MAG TPA: dihydrolipoyl dehydrogenase [Candidatus Dormibacteraeota bacterium]|jgi:dihydrolipoamide dehydrogenase|nr:dihydrolipoyl dehydrogenase [Candidatus Dormibacteraeota bacterium]